MRDISSLTTFSDCSTALPSFTFSIASLITFMSSAVFVEYFTRLISFVIAFSSTSVFVISSLMLIFQNILITRSCVRGVYCERRDAFRRFCFRPPLGEVDQLEGELDFVEHDLLRLDFCDAADEELCVFVGELEVDVVEHRDEHVPRLEVCLAQVGPEHQQRLVVDGPLLED